MGSTSLHNLRWGLPILGGQLPGPTALSRTTCPPPGLVRGPMPPVEAPWVLTAEAMRGDYIHKHFLALPKEEMIDMLIEDTSPLEAETSLPGLLRLPQNQPGLPDRADLHPLGTGPVQPELPRPKRPQALGSLWSQPGLPPLLPPWSGVATETVSSSTSQRQSPRPTTTSPLTPLTETLP